VETYLDYLRDISLALEPIKPLKNVMLTGTQNSLKEYVLVLKFLGVAFERFGAQSVQVGVQFFCLISHLYSNSRPPLKNFLRN